MRVYLSRFYSGIPDVQVDGEVWAAYERLVEMALQNGQKSVFSDSELEALETGARSAFSEIEPDRRFRGYREGVLELWTGVSNFANEIDKCCANAIAYCRANADHGFWREDFITGFVLAAIGEKFGSRKIEQSADRTVHFRFGAYKRGSRSKRREAT